MVLDSRSGDEGLIGGKRSETECLCSNKLAASSSARAFCSSRSAICQLTRSAICQLTRSGICQPTQNQTPECLSTHTHTACCKRSHHFCEHKITVDTDLPSQDFVVALKPLWASLLRQSCHLAMANYGRSAASSCRSAFKFTKLV